MSQSRLLKICLLSFIMYFGFTFIYGELFFPSVLIAWVVIYLCISYIKMYKKHFLNIKQSILLMVGAIMCIFLVFLVSDFIALKTGILNGKLLRWNTHYKPFYVIAAFSIFNIAREKSFKNRLINCISSLSMLVYIIHENIILRSIFRPALLNRFYKITVFNNNI